MGSWREKTEYIPHGVCGWGLERPLRCKGEGPACGTEEVPGEAGAELRVDSACIPGGPGAPAPQARFLGLN